MKTRACHNRVASVTQDEIAQMSGWAIKTVQNRLRTKTAPRYIGYRGKLKTYDASSIRQWIAAYPEPEVTIDAGPAARLLDTWVERVIVEHANPDGPSGHRAADPSRVTLAEAEEQHRVRQLWNARELFLQRTGLDQRVWYKLRNALTEPGVKVYQSTVDRMVVGLDLLADVYAEHPDVYGVA